VGDRLFLKRPALSAAVVSSVCSVALLAGCAPSDTEVGTIEALRARHESAASIIRYRDLTELLGNTKFQVGTQAPAALTVAVVRGHVTDVTQGQAFRVEGNDAPSGTLIEFDDSRALWRTFHATFDVAEVISGTVNGPVTVGLAVAPEVTVDTVRSDLLAMKEVVMFLEHSPVFNYDNAIVGVVGDGALIAQVDADGNLKLPVMGASESASTLARTASLDGLRAAARGPQVLIRLDETGTERVAEPTTQAN
jgi:hypothetical protein